MNYHKKKNIGNLEWINPKKIKPSEENPRGSDFYKDKDFLRLKESIIEYGVIVPIIIKKLSKKENSKEYQLIDGERRWKAALDTNQNTIPSYVLPPEKEIDILTTMFQIHMNQEGWGATEQARALEKIIINLKEDTAKQFEEKERDKELVKKLIEVTGMDSENAWSRVRFFRWPQQIREYIYQEIDKSYYSYAVEIEAKIVEPAIRNFPEIKEKISPNDMREALFAKVKAGYVSRAEEIRNAAVLVKRRTDKTKAYKAKKLLLMFIRDISFTFSEVSERYFYLFPEETQKPALSLRKLINTVRSLIKALEDYTETTVKKLKSHQRKDLKNALNSLLAIAKDAVKRLSVEK